MTLTRRQALASGVALPMAATLGVATPAAAQGMTPPNARKHSFMMGDFEVSTLLLGARPVENPKSMFGMNVSDEEFAEVSAANFIPTEKTLIPFTPTVIDTGSELVLFDTGLDPAAITLALDSVGYAPADIGTVILTHMHGDHVGGLIGDDGSLTFENARFIANETEFTHWAGAEDQTFEAKVRPLADRLEFVTDGAEVISGITAVEAHGHTPGHMTYMLDSGGQQVMILGDLANHHVWSLAYPDWEVRFDIDKAGAAAARRKILGMVAAERMGVIGYHLPFPALGFVDTRGDGFHYVPATYQFSL